MTTLALALCIALQDDAPKPDFAAELKDLEKTYQKAHQEYFAARGAAKTPEERQKVRDVDPTPKYFEKFADLAKRAEGTDAEAGALGWVFRLGSQTQKTADVRRAAERLQEKHPESPQIAQVAQGLQYAGWYGWTWAKAWLRAVAGKSTAKGARAAALLSLGCVLLQGRTVADADKAEARQSFEALVKDFAGAPEAKRAEGQLFELDHLQIGMTAPDFEATDADGKAFQLSDYRGKVVVVDFWGFW